MSELWLEPAAGPPASELEARVAFWQEREASLRLAGLEELLHADPRPPGAQGQLDTFLPVATLAADVHALLWYWFGPALRALGLDLSGLSQGALGRAKSVLEARDRLPSFDGPGALMAELGQARRAHDLLFELFASPRLGSALGRYPGRLKAIAAAAKKPVRVWDAGCATGEWTWELALGVGAAEGLGTTPWALERLMAERRERPHDPAPGAALRAFVDAHPARCAVSFQLGDVTEAPPTGTFDVVTCHGVLGGAVAEDRVPQAFDVLVSALAPEGILSVRDRFREDRSAQAAALALTQATRLGLDVLQPGLFRRRP